MMIKRKLDLSLSATDYKEQFVAAAAEHTLVDVRSPEEYGASHLAGSVNIPLQEIQERLAEIPKTKPVVLYCRSGNRSGRATKFLVDNGYEALNAGGLAALSKIGLPVELQSVM